jgi:ADP-heptose:LPS heptosyltransferase
LFSPEKSLLGWNDTRGRHFYNLKAIPGPLRYHACRNFDLLVPLGIPEVPFRLFFSIEQASYNYIDAWLKQNNVRTGEFVCIAPGSVVKKREWDPLCFQKLIAIIYEKTGYRTVLTYAPSEEPVARQIAENSIDAALVGPPTTYNQVAALISRCKLLICHDSGINHLSVATGTPTIAIFARAPTAAWSPEGIFPLHYHLKNEIQPGDQIFGSTPEEAYEKVELILAELQEQKS